MISTACMHPNQDEIYQCVGNRFGLILYNPLSRDGSDEEAYGLRSGLMAIGCYVIISKWTTKVELSKLMDQGLALCSGCSFLFVCIMSHGNAGTLRCADGDGSIIINDVIFQFTRKLSSEVPMVRMEKIWGSIYSLRGKEFSC